MDHPTPKPHVPSPESSSSFAFGPFVLIPARRLLLEEGAPVRIGKRALDLLTVFVQQQGSVLSKDELIAHAWPDSVVEEGNLKVNIAALRRLLRDDFGESQYIATVIGRGYRFTAPVQRTQNNLPARTQPIFGRQTVIASILKDLETCRLVSIVGPGGVGKTTVALAVAREAAYEDGACFVDLSGIHDDSHVVAAIGALDALRNRKLLLLLDNCEHVIDAAARCADQILTQAKQVRLLATSRESLCVKGERVRTLSGIATPPAATHMRAEAALEFGAVQLFVDHATRSCRTFALSDANASTVSEICRRLDGIALAIERVARRVGTLGVDDLLDYIGDHRHMIDEHPSSAERHRTLEASIDWSYSLLSQREQAVMRMLAVFTDAFTLDAACAIAADGVDHISVVEDVATLAAKSLLVTQARDGEMDYRQTTITRAFALSKLAAHGELESTQRRHAEYLRKSR